MASSHSELKPMRFAVQVVVEPDGGQFHAYAPALKGLHVSGATEEEALKNARDAVVAYLQSLVKHGDPIPVGPWVDEETCKLPRSRRARSHRLDLDNLVAA